MGWGVYAPRPGTVVESADDLCRGIFDLTGKRDDNLVLCADGFWLLENLMERKAMLGTKVAGLILAGGNGCGFVGCDKDRDEMRPDLDKVVSNEHGLQSRDLREMTDRMGPDLLLIPE